MATLQPEAAYVQQIVPASLPVVPPVGEIDTISTIKLFVDSDFNTSSFNPVSDFISYVVVWPKEYTVLVGICNFAES